MVRPMADLGLYLAEMADWPHGYAKYVDWLAANEGFRRRVLDQLRASGPLSSRDIPDTADTPVAVDGLDEQPQRHPDARVPRRPAARSPSPPVRAGNAGGTWRTGSTRPTCPWCRGRWPARSATNGDCGPWAWSVHGSSATAGIPVEVEGTAGEWRVDPEATAEDFEGRTAVLSPFDRLIHNRVRAQELFDFEYYLEMYKPKAARRWGYFALPVLHHDALVGKVDATVDRKASLLRVNAVHRDVRFSRAMTAAVRAELEALARWLGLDIRHS